MRRFTGIVAASALLLFSGAAMAATEIRDITLTVRISGLDEITIEAPGASVDVTNGNYTLEEGVVAFNGNMTIPVTSSTAVNSLTVTRLSNLGGTFSLGGVTNQLSEEACAGNVGPQGACNEGGGLGGAMGLTGTINVYIEFVQDPLQINLNQIRVGQGGQPTIPQLTIDAALWSTGTGYVNTGFESPPLISTLAGTSSPLTLVTPTFVGILGNNLPVFGILTLAPEPQALLLAGAGVAALVAVRRMRRR